MQFTLNVTMKKSMKKLCLGLTAIMLLTAVFAEVNAASLNKNSYSEDQFLTAFSGKSKKVILDKLGAPAKKELSVKPEGASGFLGKVGADEKDSKRVTVEMWYYKNLVNYDTKHTYKETEITFVNDRAMNIAFFNNR
jgi:hypothetical protein